MFRLWGWDATPADGAPSLGMGVIVGRALNTRTPVFVEEMRYLIFRPYWNVPPSIARQEILPALQRDPDYLTQQDMEIVSGQGDDARAVALSAESIALLRQGTLRVRQRPGPKNSLGLVKFVFPNDDNVYLHGTPARRAVQPDPARFQPRLRASRGSGGARGVGAEGSTGVDAGADSGGDEREPAAPGEPDAAHPGDSVLHHGGRDAGGWHAAFCRGHLRARCEAGPRPREPASAR